LQEHSQQILSFLEKSGPGLHGLLTRLTLREDVAEDLMQELFIKLDHSKGFAKARDQLAYAQKAAMHLAFDWWHRQKRSAVPLANAGAVASSDCTPLETAARQEQLQEVLKAVGRLRGIGREIIVMRYIEQQSYEQIAQRFGKDQHQVRALCSRAVAQLRQLLGIGKSSACRKEIRYG
jgi:RNA polymerase sigma factor (sigma-70 family)